MVHLKPSAWATTALLSALAWFPHEAAAGNLCPGRPCPLPEVSISRASSIGWGSIHETYQMHRLQSNSHMYESLSEVVATNVAAANTTLNEYKFTGAGMTHGCVNIATDRIVEDRADMRASHRMYYPLVKRMEDLLHAYWQFPRWMRSHYGAGSGDESAIRTKKLEVYAAHYARIKRFSNARIEEIVCPQVMRQEVLLEARINGPLARWAMKHTVLLEELRDGLGNAPAVPSPDGSTEKLQDRVWVGDKRLEIFKKEYDARKGSKGYLNRLNSADVKFAKVKAAANVTANRLKIRRLEPKKLKTAGRFDPYYYTLRYHKKSAHVASGQVEDGSGGENTGINESKDDETAIEIQPEH